MAEGIENVILEHLKRFQGGQDRIERKLEEVVTRLGALEVSVASVHRDMPITKKTQQPSACAWIV